jgi:hypothetical protein
MSVDEVAAELRAVLENVRQQRAVVAGIASSIERVRGQLLSLTQGSQHLLVRRMLGAWGAALQWSREADELLAGCAAALIKYMTAIGASVEGEAVAGGGTTPGAAAERMATASAPAKPGSSAPIPAHVQRLGERLTPWQPGGDTVGYAYDPERLHLDDERFVSGRRREAAGGIRRVRGRGLPATVTDHVEGHVAARMRQPGGPQEATLVLNNPPCKERPFGCHWLLPDILPEGAALTVYVKTERGVELHRRYTGTGRGIEP